MKKAFSFFLAFALFFSVLLAAPSFGATNVPSIYMKPSVNEAKDTLTVEIYTDGLKWTAVDLGLKFNPSALTLQSVTVGSKILKAQSRGFEFITGHKDIAESNSAGYCNFVAAVGSSTCDMTNYSGAIVVYTFAVKDLTQARTGYHLCVSTLVNSAGTALLDYTSFGPADTPVVYLENASNPFRYGDVNIDGEVTIFDATLILRYLVEMTELNEYQMYAAKVSRNESISVFDATLIMRYLVGMIDSFPIES